MNDTQYEYMLDVIERMTSTVRKVNEANGWFEDDRRFGEDIALLHSEVSEALEAWRDDHGVVARVKYGSYLNGGDGYQIVQRGNNRDVQLRKVQVGKPLGVGSEMADVLIRLLDTCDRHGINLAYEFSEKLKFNATRGHKHGGKAL